MSTALSTAPATRSESRSLDVKDVCTTPGLHLRSGLKPPTWDWLPWYWYQEYDLVSLIIVCTDASKRQNQSVWIDSTEIQTEFPGASDKSQRTTAPPHCEASELSTFSYQ